MAGAEIDRLIQLLAKLPGLGPRSARRVALHLVRRKESLMEPLARALADAAAAIRLCSECGNIDTQDPCAICADPRRDPRTICVVEQVADLWALERTGQYKGRYHVLGGTLSALEIEEVLRAHPAIAECAVVGIADPEWGERVALAVELKPGASVSLEDLQTWAKPQLAPYKVPRALRSVDTLPRNAMGKVLKPDVAALFAP